MEFYEFKHCGFKNWIFGFWIVIIKIYRFEPNKAGINGFKYILVVIYGFWRVVAENYGFWSNAVKILRI